jgi:uncharacterized protein (UPF0333 family)
MDKKGQGALEYLLLIGGAVLVAVIVIALLITLTSTGETETGKTVTEGLCNARPKSICSDTTIDVDGKTYSCTWDASNKQCTTAQE